MTTERHAYFDGKIQLYRRPESRHWHCSASIGGKQQRSTTKEENLTRAKEAAWDWYLTLSGKYAAGTLQTGMSFKKAAELFLAEYESITQGERSPSYVEKQEMNVRVHLMPFFGSMTVNEINGGTVQQYRAHRQTSRKDKDGNAKRPSRSSLHHETITLRHILRTANRHGALSHIPEISAPYKTSGKISRRAWFSPEEYKQLYKATAERAKKPLKERWRSACEDLHDYVLFMVNSGLRPDEAKLFEVRDVEIVADGPNDERILHIAVRGKRGVGHCKTMPGAVLPFQRMVKRHGLKATDRVFPKIQRELLNTVLRQIDLKHDREGKPRSAYSLRHTYICFRLTEGADIYQVAKNCRTSVEMIEKFYASHIKDMIDASAVNVRKPRR